LGKVSNLIILNSATYETNKQTKKNEAQCYQRGRGREVKILRKNKEKKQNPRGK
jgi:hypothetical protein